MKNSQTYKINVIGAPDSIGNMFTFKNLKESENGYTNPVIENESQVKKRNSDVEDSEGSDFETAIKATGYGKFNWLLLIFIAWGFMSCMNATTTISFILPSAECDLNLSNFDKGMLNSVIFIGMTINGFFWGLLSDALGRKSILMVAYGLDAFFSTLVGLAQNFTFLLIAKLFTGFICSGPMAILISYLAENHSTIYRGSTTVCAGVFTSFATIVLPFLAWLIIPRDIRIVLFNGYISLTSWRIFLLVSAIPSIVAFIGLFFLEESPKFLMFQGNNEEALRVLRKIYKMNTGKPKDTFPIKRLRDEMGNDQKTLRRGGLSTRQVISTSWKQMVPIFHRPHLLMALLPCFIQFCTLLGMNAVRLWSPQLFASAIENEKYSYNSTPPSTICELLGAAPGTEAVDNVVHCNANPVEDKVYFNSMITGIVTVICYLISGYIVKFWEKKWLMILAYLLSISCCFGLYWSNTSNTLLGVISLLVAFTSASATALTSAVIDIFPTSLRSFSNLPVRYLKRKFKLHQMTKPFTVLFLMSDNCVLCFWDVLAFFGCKCRASHEEKSKNKTLTTAVSLCMTFGRMGALVGNLAFPILLDLNCTAPFILLGVVNLAAASLTLLLPNTKGKDLK